MFFKNFKPLILSLDDEKKKKIKNNLKYATCYVLSLSTLYVGIFKLTRKIISFEIRQPASYNVTVEKLNETPEFTVETIKNLINSNPNLDEVDKAIILNDELLNFAVPYINMNKEYRAELYNFILPNFKITKGTIERDNVIGSRYYDELIIDVNKINDINNYIDTLNHEFTHTLMPFNVYSFIDEGFTEMVSNEFGHLDNDPINSYSKNQKYIKILMDIIGTDPITKYCFTGNIDYIKTELINYLPENKLNELIECFKIIDDDENFNKVESILKDAFLEKYGIKMEDSYFMSNHFLNTDLYNDINYLNNPTNEIRIDTRGQKPIYNEDNAIIGFKDTTSSIYIPKEILITSQNINEAFKKYARQQSYIKIDSRNLDEALEESAHNKSK